MIPDLYRRPTVNSIVNQSDDQRETLAKIEQKRREISQLMKEAKRVTGGKGGRPAKTLEQHRRDGTYRADRHGHLIDQFVPPEKPAGKVTASAASQSKYCRNEADYRAVRNGCRFNEALGMHVVNVFEKFFRHTIGEWWRKPFELLPWEREELILPLFGWVRPDGTRRYRRTYIEIPKKNGKTEIASGVGLYMLAFDLEPGSEVYSCAADKDQARISHSGAVNMVEASEVLDANFDINRTTGTIKFDATKSYYRACSASPRGKHGFRIHCAILDELHEWYGSELWEALKYGYRTRREPLQFVITNAGDDMGSICRAQHDKARGILDGTIHDDEFFALIYSAPELEVDNEIEAVRNGATELPVARSCNPSLGAILKEEQLLADIRDAIDTPSELPNLKRFTYSVWATGEAPWLRKTDWDKCYEQYDEESLAGATCVGGLDLSKTKDLTCLNLIFPNEDKTEFRQYPIFWLPELEAREKNKIVSYLQWGNEGFVRIVPGEVIDYAIVERDIVEVSKKFDLREVHFDPKFSADICQRLVENHSIDCVPFPQTIMEFANPTTEYERLIIAGAMKHNGNDCLTWQAGHSQVITDANKNKRPTKRKHGDYRTIDGIVAGIMGLKGALALRKKRVSVYKKRGVLVLK